MTNEQLLEALRAALADSELARDLAAVRADGGLTFALRDGRCRLLYQEEVARLERQGNSCDDWGRVRVSPDFDFRRVTHSTIHGDVVLGGFWGRAALAGGLELPTGVYHSTVADCVLGDDVLVRDVKLLANCVLGPGAVAWDCGAITCAGDARFGNGAMLPVGLEGDGRRLPVFAEITVDLLAALVRACPRRPVLRQYLEMMAGHLPRVTLGRGVIAAGARVCHTPRVENAYVGPHARVEGAALLRDSTLLSSADEPALVLTGAVVTGSLLQWGSRVDTAALVDGSVLAEHSAAERQAKVTHSVLGPSTTVAQGEATASVLGPFVGFHHQALAIATFWPEGKGNVSHGASVGCNHTSRAPDQECRPGEGMFFGLGASVKFPADFSRSPYSVLACGVTTLPQRLAFPFSLVNQPSASWPGVPAAYNEVVPGWALAENLYALVRAEEKYRARNEARRAAIPCDVFRPDTVELMRDACRRLGQVRQVKEVYTDRDVEGLGKNYLTEANRRRAVEAYRFFARLYALLGLKEHLESLPAAAWDAGWRDCLAAPAAAPRWDHQRRVLAEELGHAGPADALGLLPAMLAQVARGVEVSRLKDDERGRRTIDDYAETHAPAADDPLVRRTWARTRRLAAETENLLARRLAPQKSQTAVLPPPAVHLQPALPAEAPACQLWGAA